MDLANKQKYLGLYAGLGVSVLLSSLPYSMAQNLSLCLIIATLITSYVVKAKSSEDSLERHHAIYIIRTIWIWSSFYAIGLMGAGLTIAQNGDMSEIQTLIDNITNGNVMTEADMQASFHAYLTANYTLIMKTAIMWLAPVQLYAVYRLAKGLSRGLKGYRLPKVLSWF